MLDLCGPLDYPPSVPSRSHHLLQAGPRGLDLPVLSIHTGPGPTAIVTANVHGDECTGIGAILQLLPELETQMVAGTVHLYPSLNPEGLEQRSRRVPGDDQDLNRLFPGDARGNPSERLAQAIWEDIKTKKPDLLIDLHADAASAIPYALLDRGIQLRGDSRRQLEQRARALATASGLTILEEYPEDRYRRYRLDRALTGAVMNRLQVPTVTLEAGPRLYLEEGSVATLRAALKGILHAAGLLPDAPLPHPSRIAGRWRRDAGPRAGVAGILLPLVRPGVILKKGEPVAEIWSLTGERLEQLQAEAEGFVVSLAERSHVVAGVPVCTWAFSEDS